MIPTVQNQALLQQQGIAGKPTAKIIKALQDAQLKFTSWQDSPMLSSRPICRTSFESDRSPLHSTQSVSGGRPFVRPLAAIPHPSAAAWLRAPRSAPPAFWDKPVVHRSQQSPRPLPPLPPLSPVPSSDGEESLLACGPSSPCPVYFTSHFDDHFDDGCKSTSPSFFPPNLDSVWACVDSGVPPEVPSPTTAQRRRVAKLRRLLGESVVDLLLDRGDTQLGAGHSRSMSLSGSSADHGGCSSVFNHYRSVHGHGADSAETSEDEEDFEDVVSQEHEGGEEREQADYSWILSNGRIVQTSRRNRYRKKWIFEKGGRRWVMDDYDEVLHALRTL